MKFTRYIFIFFLSLLVLRGFFLDFYLVRDFQMAPTLLKNDYLVTKKYSYGFKIPFIKKYLFQWRRPQRGDVVVFKTAHDTQKYAVKRIVAGPGDRLFYSKGMLFINEESFAPFPPSNTLNKEWDFLVSSQNFQKKRWSRYIHWSENLSKKPYSILLKKDYKISFGPYKIPKKHYFVMGDHRSRSEDSRTWPTYAQKARIQVRLKKRDQVLDQVHIPKKTSLFLKKQAPYFLISFKTKKSILLDQEPVVADIEADQSGFIPPLRADDLLIQKDFQKKVSVHVVKNMHSGQDLSLIRESDIDSKAWTIIWGCKKTLPLLNFLCHFNSFIKNRFLWPVHKD